MALDMTCMPTIRENVVRMRQADRLHVLEEGLFGREAAGRSAQATSAGRDVASRRRSHRHRPSRLVHVH